MSESNEVQIARVDEKLKAILAELAQARDGRKQQYEKLESVGRYIQILEARIEAVEKSLAKASPTIDEFLVIKHRVTGAGLIGKWIWLAAGSLIGIVAASKTTIFEWLSK
uniref:Tail length tape-measure protein n=1 Tax=Pseudomonas phage Arace01 TaxID=3138526 RepID=A0AAU6VZJ9_9VIRU